MKNKNQTNETNMTNFNAGLNYILNKCMPILLISFIVFNFFGAQTWQPYVVLFLIMFSNRFSFGCGYASSLLENQETEYQEKEI
jgi:hypothetical protein